MNTIESKLKVRVKSKKDIMTAIRAIKVFSTSGKWNSDLDMLRTQYVIDGDLNEQIKGIDEKVIDLVDAIITLYKIHTIIVNKDEGLEDEYGRLAPKPMIDKLRDVRYKGEGKTIVRLDIPLAMLPKLPKPIKKDYVDYLVDVLDITYAGI